MIKNALRAFVVFAAVLAWTTACTPSAPTGAAEDAAALSGRTLEGKTVSLSEYKGKVVLVDFWATWCGPCLAEIPELIKLQANLGDKDFVILGVSMDEETAEVAPFADKMGINSPIIVNGGENAPKGWVVPGLPTAYLISRDGKVLQRKFGSKSIDTLTADVKASLAR